MKDDFMSEMTKRQRVALSMPCVIHKGDSELSQFLSKGKAGLKTIMTIEPDPTTAEGAVEFRWHVSGSISNSHGKKPVVRLRRGEQRRLRQAMNSAMGGAAEHEFDEGKHTLHLYRPLTAPELAHVIPAIERQKDGLKEHKHRHWTIEAYPFGQFIRIRVYSPDRSVVDGSFEKLDTVDQGIHLACQRIDSYDKRINDAKEINKAREKLEELDRQRKAVRDRAVREALKTIANSKDESREITVATQPNLSDKEKRSAIVMIGDEPKE